MSKNKTNRDKSDDRSADKYKNVPTGLTQEQIVRLDEIAKIENKSRSEVIREAVQDLLLSRQQDSYEARESALVREILRMEKGLRTLIVKGVRVNAQALYFASLPFQLGPPRAALTKQSYLYHYERSLSFASMVLKDNNASRQITASQNTNVEGGEAAI